MNIMLLAFIFVVSAFLGTELISKVPSQLHTPLMSATNAISGITIVGALIICAIKANTFDLSASGAAGIPGMILAFSAIILASINVVGGYSVTQRMLDMFKKKEGEGK